MKSIEGMEADRLCIGMIEATKMLGISRRKLWELVNRKAIPHFRIGARILFPIESLKEWIADQTVGGVR